MPLGEGSLGTLPLGGVINKGDGMSKRVKVGTIFYPTIDTEFDKFGIEGEFILELINASTGGVVPNGATGTWSEVIGTDPLTTGTADGDALAGAKTVVLGAGHTFVAGNRFDDGAGNIYYIVSTTATSMTLKRALTATIPDTTVLSSVGNMGIYKVDVQVDTADINVIANVSHPEMGTVNGNYDVVNYTIDEIGTTVDSIAGAIDSGSKMKFVV